MLKIKSSRSFSFIVIALVYAIATVSGILIYRSLSCELWLNFLIADVSATAIVFLFSLIFTNASVYDPYWSVLPIIVVVAFACKYGLNTLSLLLLIAICFWGIRLTANWAYTFKN